MFTYVFWARTFVLSSLICYFYYGNNDSAILFTNVAIVLAILATVQKKEE